MQLLEADLYLEFPSLFYKFHKGDDATFTRHVSCVSIKIKSCFELF